MTIDQAVEVRNAYFTLYPKILDWHRKVEEDVTRGFVVTPMGRIRRDIKDFKVAANTPVQATASDICMYAVAEIYRTKQRRELPPFDLIAFVHDSIGILATEEVIDEAARGCQEIMEGLDFSRFGFSLPLPLVAEPKIADYWQ